MPGGEFDSSKTRVGPVFKRLAVNRSDWVRGLLRLARDGSGASVPADLNLAFNAGHWEETEKGLEPPVALLSWLIRNFGLCREGTLMTEERERLRRGDPDTIGAGLELLRTNQDSRGWWILEGQTYPDALIETPDALIVVEGKRKESGPTTHTTWMANRHQMLRHLDAAWEIRGRRAVYGLFIVEGMSPSPLEVPPSWREAAQATIAPDAIGGSLPHRGPEERAEIVRAFLGVATWQNVCAHFGIEFQQLPDRVSNATGTDV